ncbi:MAG: hypothetical protein JW861_00040 [Bacteroidales bacterium]|nr:hypothetical protein [Bacteroidales bacterium]
MPHYHKPGSVPAKRHIQFRKKYGLLFSEQLISTEDFSDFYYPYALSVHNFEPITGRTHQPPPVHQTFDAGSSIMCSFVPRLYDYHTEAIPVTYNHSNVDSDEVLYYVDGEFMSRKHVSRGQFTLHPMGIPHGTHPETVKKSLGANETRELAIMIDTYRPLWLTRAALRTEDRENFKSWPQ